MVKASWDYFIINGTKFPMIKVMKALDDPSRVINDSLSFAGMQIPLSEIVEALENQPKPVKVIKNNQTITRNQLIWLLFMWVGLGIIFFTIYTQI